MNLPAAGGSGRKRGRGSSGGMDDYTHPAGAMLRNITGSMCYINAALHSLAAIPELQRRAQKGMHAPEGLQTQEELPGLRV